MSTSTRTLKMKVITPETFTVPFGEKGYNVKEFLTTDERLELVSKVIATVSIYNPELNFLNTIQLRIFTWLYAIEFYTDIKITDKQWEEPAKTYDLFYKNGVCDKIKELASDDFESLIEDIDQLAENLYNYKNSALGVLDSIQQHYRADEIDIEELNKKIADPESLSFLKEVMEKMN